MRLSGCSDAEFGHAADDAGQASGFGDGENLGCWIYAACFGDIDVKNVYCFCSNTRHCIGWCPDAFVGHNGCINVFPHVMQANKIAEVQGLFYQFDLKWLKGFDVSHGLFGICPAHVRIYA